MEITIDKSAFTLDQFDTDITTQGADRGTESDNAARSVKVSVMIDPLQYSVNDSTEFNMRIVKEVENFFEKHDQSSPFFIYAALGQVHIPHSPPNFYLDGTPIAGTYDNSHLDLLYEMDC